MLNSSVTHETVDSGDVASFTENGVITTDGRALGPFNLVVAATGYEKVSFC